MILNNIIKMLDEKLKIKEQENWDNSGLQIGSTKNDIKKIMLALDLDKSIVDFSVNNNIDLIITHHPIIFTSIKSIDYDSYDGQMIRDLIRNNINVYSIHTNYDMAEKGVNYELAQKLGFENYDILHIVNEYDSMGYGGISSVEPIHITEYANNVKKVLGCNAVKLFCYDDKKIIKRVAFCGGSGEDFIDDAIHKNADIYVTGDIKYHQAQYALKNGLSIIDAGHFYTEISSINYIKKILEENTSLQLHVSEENTVPEILIL